MTRFDNILKGVKKKLKPKPKVRAIDVVREVPGAVKKIGKKIFEPQKKRLEKIGDPLVQLVQGNPKPVKEAAKKFVTLPKATPKQLSKEEQRQLITKHMDKAFMLSMDAKLKVNPKSIIQGAKNFLKPVETRIAQQGQAGQKLKSLITRATDAGEVEAGKRMAELKQLRLNKLKKPERFNLMDVLEGRDKPLNEKVIKAFTVARKQTNELGEQAKKIGVQVKQKRTVIPDEPLPKGLTPFQRQSLGEGKKVFATLKKPFEQRSNYYPHQIPDVEQLAKGKVRKDIVENLVRQKISATPEEAKLFIDDYVNYIETGAKKDSLVKYMSNTGQATDEAEALMKLQRYRQRTIKRQGSLEYARDVDLPFYDPDPARVLPKHVSSTSQRLEQIKNFGQDDQEINKLINEIRKEGGDADTVRYSVDRILGKINDRPQVAKASQLLRTLQGFKLGLAAIPNASQGVLNSLLKGDLRAVGYGLGKAFTKSGRQFALKSGATLESTLQESMRESGSASKVLGKFLKATGFSATEKFNRTLAANAGKSYGQRLIKKVLKNPADKTVRGRLTELGINVDEALKRGFNDDDVLMVAKKFTDITQFRSRPQDLPLFASSPEGKVFFQFKNFIYGQTRLLHNVTIKELKAGNYGRAVRNVIILGSIFPLAGEAIADLRAVVTGRKRDTKGLKRYFENIAQVGAMGMLMDTLQAGKYQRGVGSLVGPTLDEAGQLINIAGGENKGKNLAKYATKRLPLIGQIIGNRAFPTKEAKKKPSRFRP